MLNQSNNYFNYILTYLDQGGNNLWWSANSISNVQTTAQLITTGTGIDADCIETDCIPICSDIVESEQQTTESLNKPQLLIYPSFYITKDLLTIKLNNLELTRQPNYIEDGCIDSTCIDEYGLWTKAIKTTTSVLIEDDTYYFIKADPDKYGYGYIYNLSLIHEETGEEIQITKNKGITNSTIYWEQQVPNGFNPVITIIKFDIEQVITTYKFIYKPQYLRDTWLLDIPWQPLTHNIEEVLLSIYYLFHTDLEIINKNELILYGNKQERFKALLVDTLNSIILSNSYNHSYIKSTTTLISNNSLATTTNYQDIEPLLLNPGIYSTTNYLEQSTSSLIIILILLVQTKLDVDLTSYANKCIELELTNLKEEVLRILALVETYRNNKDIYYLSKATTYIEIINKLYKLDEGDYIESLDNPTKTIESKVYGDLLESYVNNKEINIKDYIIEEITYIDTTDILYLLNQPSITTNNPVHILLLKLVGNFNIKLNKRPCNKLIVDILNINNTNYITNNILTGLEMYNLQLFNNFKSYIPTDFTWLSSITPIQDLIIKSIIKPLIDLYLHSKYIQELFELKTALIKDYTYPIIVNTKELLPQTITTDSILIRDSLWPGSYSNSVDIEVKGYYDKSLLEEVNNNVKSVGIEANLISALEIPNQSNFNLCFNIVKLEDYRCQVDINGQLILLPDGQCDLAPPEQSILLQENTSPVTQETSINDYFII